MDTIRLATKDDRAALIEICLLTGRSGQDASSLFNEKQMLGDYYVAPYLDHDPDYAFVLSQAGRVTGYAVGTLNSDLLKEYLTRNYLPLVRPEYFPRIGSFTDAERELWGIYTAPHPPNLEFLRGYPSELHIDLLPQSQGQGFGRKLMKKLLATLKAGGSPGVHLILSADNQSAYEFYRHLNFQELARDSECITMGISFREI